MRYRDYQRNSLPRNYFLSYLLVILGCLVIFFGFMALMPIVMPLFFVLLGFWLLNVGMRMQKRPPLSFFFVRTVSRLSRKFFH